MRRLWAAALVAVFSFTLIGPAAFDDGPVRNLPPCCRASGKHHCSLTEHRKDSGSGFVTGRCPSFSLDQTAPQVPVMGPARVREASAAAVPASNFVLPTSRPRSHRYFDHNGLKRGPPSLSKFIL